MRTHDFSPLFRSTVGFDRMQRLIESALGADESNLSYPPYNIERRDEDSYAITMAVAGFGENDLDITTTENTLVISGHSRNDGNKSVYLHRGIAGRSFERRFQLAEHIKIIGAKLENGILHVDLVREVPEALKPRRIAIFTKGAAAEPLTREAA